MIVVITDEAATDLEALGDWIALEQHQQKWEPVLRPELRENKEIERIGEPGFAGCALDNPLRAITFVQTLRQTCLALADMPLAFPLVPRYASDGVRWRPYRDYLIFYRVTEEAVEILHVLHAAQDYERILSPNE